MDVEDELTDVLARKESLQTRIQTLEAQVKTLSQAIRRSWGQEKSPDLRFVVAVSGLGASPHSSSQMAQVMCQRLTDLYQIHSDARVSFQVDAESYYALEDIGAGADPDLGHDPELSPGHYSDPA